LDRPPSDGAARQDQMNGFFDVYTLIFLILAVVIFLRLRSVLGRRTGAERPPYDPYSARDAARDAKPQPAPETVTPLPDRSGGAAASGAAGDEERWRGLVEPGSSAARGLSAIQGADRGFDVRHFLTGARQAYEMIVTAFAEGDRKTLKGLLSKEVYEGFVAAIASRESRGERIESNFIGIEKAEIADATLKGSTAQITIRFVSQLISVTRDKAGVIIDGDPKKVTDVIDIWTFARDVASKDPNWKLVATESV
jgi:predicted lipid-binding transport protein (Tim44 family)